MLSFALLYKLALVHRGMTYISSSLGIFRMHFSSSTTPTTSTTSTIGYGFGIERRRRDTTTNAHVLWYNIPLSSSIPPITPCCSSRFGCVHDSTINYTMFHHQNRAFVSDRRKVEYLPFQMRKERKSGDELRQFEVFQFFKEGNFNRQSLDLKEITKILPKGFRLRDLRGHHGRQISQILVREGHYWVIVEHLVAVVTADNMILFRANTQNVSEFAEQLSKILQANSGIGENQENGVPPIGRVEPFELVVLDEILSAIIQDYNSRMNLMIPLVQESLKCFASNSATTDDAVARMIPMSNTLNNFQTSISELRSAVEDVLESEADMSNLCITYKDRSARLEVEMLLENFYKKTEELHNETQEILSNIQTTKKALEMGMSNTRNQLMRLNLHISLMTLTMTSAAVTTSIFGMNLNSGYEAHPYMFYYVVFFLPVIALSVYSTFLWNSILHKKKFMSVTESALSSTFYDNISSNKYLQQLADKTSKDFKSILEAATGYRLDQAFTDQIQRQIKIDTITSTSSTSTAGVISEGRVVGSRSASQHLPQSPPVFHYPLERFGRTITSSDFEEKLNHFNLSTKK